MTTTTPSLGHILRTRIEDEKNNARLKLEREAREAGEKAQQDLRTVTEFFEDAKIRFTRNILDGVALQRIKVGQRENQAVEQLLATYRDPQVNTPGHKYYPVWQDFAKWASDNDLKPLWTYAHDGVGMESWNFLSVEPK